MSKHKAKVISINSKKTDKASPKKPGKTPSKIYQIKVSLCGTDPSIWRRLLIAGDTNLGLLHGILQISMGWQNSHLHQFMVEETFYSDPEAELEDVRNELNTTISKIAPAEKDNFMYMYDFGDSWDHVIQVEKILPEHKDFALPAACIGGKGPVLLRTAAGYPVTMIFVKSCRDRTTTGMMKCITGLAVNMTRNILMQARSKNN